MREMAQRCRVCVTEREKVSAACALHTAGVKREKGHALYARRERDRKRGEEPDKIYHLRGDAE